MTPLDDRDAVLFPPIRGGNGNRSLHHSSGNMGTVREPWEPIDTLSHMELFRTTGTDKPKRDHFSRPKKIEEFPTSGTDKKGPNSKLKHLPSTLGHAQGGDSLDPLTCHQQVQTVSLGEKRPRRGALCHICATKKASLETPKRAILLSINELYPAVIGAVLEGVPI